MNFPKALAPALFCAGSHSGLTPAPPAPFKTHQLTPNVYWVEGGGGNSGVIVGRTGVIVIDAKITEAGGRAPMLR